MYILPPSISKKIEGYRWQSFTPPAAGKSRRFRGLICHRRSHIGLDPAEEMLTYAKRMSEAVPFTVEYLALQGESIPLEPESVDTVLVTYTLCTIPDAIAALEGMRQVLKQSGRLIFCEHGKAPDEAIRRWQDRLNPLWGRLGGGCNLNRDIPALIEAAGFGIDNLETMYLGSTPRFAGFNYWGSARPR